MDERNSAGVKRRRLFSDKDDHRLEKIIMENPFTGWKDVANMMPGFTAKQLRDRWHNYISPRNSNQPWTPEEDRIIKEKVQEFGTRWSQIAIYLVGRSDNSIKNRYNTVLKEGTRKTSEKQEPNLTDNESAIAECITQVKSQEPPSKEAAILDDRFISRFFERLPTQKSTK